MPIAAVNCHIAGEAMPFPTDELFGFLSCERAFELNLVLFAYACFYFLFFKIQLKKYVTVIYVKECPAYVFLYEFCNI